MILLDTSAIIHIFKGTDIGKEIVSRFREEIIFVSSPSIHEIMYGIKPKENKSVSNFFSTFEILPYDEEAAYESAKIKKTLKEKGRIIQDIDIMIASVSKNKKLKIVTTDKGFKNISGTDVSIF